MEKEIWKDVPGYEGLYEVSNLGRVKSLSRVVIRSDGHRQPVPGKILKNAVNSNGYALVSLCNTGNQKNYFIHTLVAIAFLNHKPDGYNIVVDHINNNGLDNKVENLQLISHRLNMSKDKFRLGKSSRFTGVWWSKENKKWRAKISVGGKNKHLGYFNVEEDAASAYQGALKKIINIKEN